MVRLSIKRKNKRERFVLTKKKFKNKKPIDTSIIFLKSLLSPVLEYSGTKKKTF